MICTWEYHLMLPLNVKRGAPFPSSKRILGSCFFKRWTVLRCGTWQTCIFSFFPLISVKQGLQELQILFLFQLLFNAT